MAREGENPSELDEDGFFWYPVDSGNGTLAGLVALRALATWDADRIEDVYIPSDWPTTPVPGALGAVTDEASGANVIKVDSGWGDGLYPTFIGHTDTDEVACFVTDFRVVVM